MKILLSKIELLNKPEYDFLGKEEVTLVDVCIAYDEIVAVRENVDGDTNEIKENICVVYLKNGEYFYIHTPYHEVVNYMMQSR